MPAEVHRALSGVLRRHRSIEQSLTLAIQVAQVIGLKSVGQNAKQKVSRQVRGRLPPEHGTPTGAKDASVEIAQVGDLDFEGVPVLQRRTDLDARHDAQCGRRLDWRGSDLPLSLLVIW